MIRFLVGLIGRPAMLGWALAGVMALVGGAYALGRQQGGDAANSKQAAEQARLQSQMIRAAEIASRNEATRLVAVAKIEQLTRELEDAAHTDRNAGRIALGADSVRRLNRR
ncbi:MAG: hypothetical protein GXP05_10335 [Alphaproteobacteria bacterium]|nr:hypothetical protein [Alphaproteobacteria bacterium]